MLKNQKINLKNNFKFILSSVLILNSTLTLNAYNSILPSTEISSLLSNVRSNTSFNLNAVAYNSQNNIYLDWSSNDSSNKTFKVYQKKPGNSNFQTISSTNFDKNKKVNVLNVYPSVGSSITFKTYNNIEYTLPKSASLKMWMESPTSYIDSDGSTVNVPYGFGKGLITVTPVSFSDFNASPDMYLKNPDGTYIYDVIMFGSWDSNNGLDLSVSSSEATKNFLDSGRGVLFGHDTMRTFACPNFSKLISYANLENYTGSYYNGVEGTTGFGSGPYYPLISNIKVVRNGLLVNYPWNVGVIDTPLQIPASHNTQLSNGDIWMRYTHSSYTDSNMNDKNNFYLSTWNNTAMIQTGHSNGDATKDEQKLLANTLFYLNQLSTSTTLTDNSGQDVTAPEKPAISLSSANISSATYTLSQIKDIGTSYEYYVTAEDKNGSISNSNTVKATVTSGFKGYSYVIDNKANTEPDNTVEISKVTDSIVVNLKDTNKDYYIHIKSIDNQNNISDTVHVKVDAPKLKATANNKANNVSLEWSLINENNKIFKVYQKKEGSNSFQSISTTNFSNTQKVNVLNVYPSIGDSIIFTTYDGKNYTLPKAASLKMWMESPTSYVDDTGKTVNVPYGFGKGLINVTPLTIDEFNLNPNSYLKNSDGSYKYDVIMFGSWDSNGSSDINNTSCNAVIDFLNSGRGVLFGHDTMRAKAFTYFSKLMSYANLEHHTGVYYNGVAEDADGFDYSGIANYLSSVKIIKKGLLTNYPWLIDEVDNVLKVPSTHNNQLSNGDIWLRFSHNAYTNSDMSNPNNFYLSTWNNTAMIQTGHSKGEATKDEQKLLANTLFYLNQISIETSLTDNSGQDVAAPEKPVLSLLEENINTAVYTLSSIKDIGTSYEYYVLSEDKVGSILKSNTEKVTVTSGVKGYSYCIDNSSNTEPDNLVDITNLNSTIKVDKPDTSKTYYIHIKSIDNANNISETVHIKIDNIVLKATANNKNNNVSLEWSLSNELNKIFKVYQKKEGSSEFQSISSTDFSNTKKVKVLNIYPIRTNSTSLIPIITYSTWDGETLTVPKSASLKKWMEEPNSEDPKGYGKGIIEVTPVSIDDFNSNFNSIMKDSNGNWLYDVIMLGSWDGKGNLYPTVSSEAVDIIQTYILDGRGFLAGHDTIGYTQGTQNGLGKIRDLFNIKVGKWNWGDGVADDGYDYFGGFMSNKTMLQKKGLLVNYPWNLGEIGTTFDIPTSHSTSNFAYGDIWMTYPTDALYTGNQIPENLYPYANYYLTTWNNTAMIQTGHSNGAATTDEQKILANTLFYLNQISTETSLIDNSGQDVKSPQAPSIKLISTSKNQLQFDFSETKDLGSTYEYYVVSEDKNNNTVKSNTVSASVITGIKGYSYVLDKKTDTEPSNAINCTSNILTLNNIDNSIYYLHVKAIDNANNVSETKHFKVSTSNPVSPVLNTSRSGWGTTDVIFTISQKHNKNVKILSLSTHERTPLVDRLKSLGYNITSNPSLTDVNEISKYDVVIVDAYCWGVQNASLLKTLYDNGTKIFTIGNDTSNSIYPISSTKLVGDVDLTMNRVTKNEATFGLTAYNGGPDSNAYLITSAIKESSNWYTLASDNSPYVLNVENGNDGIWIHSQSMLGLYNNKQSDEFIMGTIDYLTKSISQFHLKDVQYKIDNGNWISYNGETVTISTEGSHTISTRNVDSRGEFSAETSSIVGIDRTAPLGEVYVSPTTLSRIVTVSLDSLLDSLSGLNKVRLSNYSDFRDNLNYTSINNVSNINLNIEIPFLSNLTQNYSNRTIYVEILDNVGNKKVLNCNTLYEPKNPGITILSPKPNSLFVKNELIKLSWKYDGSNNDGVVLPQTSAIICVNSLDFPDTIKPITYNISDESTSVILSDLQKGSYSISVTVYNSFGKYTKSTDVVIRHDLFSTKGDLLTQYIAPGSPLQYISVLTESEIPAGTEVHGYVYYAKKENDIFSENNKVEFSISNSQLPSSLIKLPYACTKIKIKYDLYNKTTAKYISPALCNLIVLGK